MFSWESEDGRLLDACCVTVPHSGPPWEVRLRGPAAVCLPWPSGLVFVFWENTRLCPVWMEAVWSASAQMTMSLSKQHAVMSSLVLWVDVLGMDGPQG